MYEGELRDAVLKAKHLTSQTLAVALAELMVATHGDAIRSAGIDCVIPIPMHWKRRFLRGVNQTETLAQTLAARLQTSRKHALRRVAPTLPQGGLSAAARRDNVRGAFRIRRGVQLEGKRVLLVDDIVTTGATCMEAAEQLRSAGAAEVVVAVVARADRPISGGRNRLYW